MIWQQGIDVVEAYKVSRGKESYLSRLMVPDRQHGVTASSHLKLLKFSFTAIMSFSTVPLHLFYTNSDFNSSSYLWS